MLENITLVTNFGEFDFEKFTAMDGDFKIECNGHAIHCTWYEKDGAAIYDILEKEFETYFRNKMEEKSFFEDFELLHSDITFDYEIFEEENEFVCFFYRNDWETVLTVSQSIENNNESNFSEYIKDAYMTLFRKIILEPLKEEIFSQTWESLKGGLKNVG